MKWLAALCLISTPACVAGYVQEMHVHDAEPQTVLPEPPAPVLAQRVRYDEDFLPAAAQNVCVETASDASPDVPWWMLTGEPHRLVSAEHGSSYVFSPAANAGSFGSFHYARDAAGALWGVKQMHAALRETNDDDLRRELGLWQLLGPESAVHEVLQFDGGNRTAVIMALMDGNVGSLLYSFTESSTDPNARPGLGDLVGSNDAAQRATLARSVLSQVAHNAQALHTLGYVHNDLRPANIFWRQDGRIVLGDYGLAYPVEADGRLERAPWAVVVGRNVGIGVAEFIAAPEVLSSRYNAKADSWSLGLAILDILVPTTSFGTALGQEALINPAGFTAWRATVTDAAGHANLDAIVDSQVETVPVRYYLFNEVFFSAKQTDPELARLVLEHLLTSDPDERWDMGQIEGAIEAPALQDVAALIAERGALALAGRQLMLDELDACAASLADQESGEPSGP